MAGMAELCKVIGIVDLGFECKAVAGRSAGCGQYTKAKERQESGKWW
jgi:hypothetical protein